MKKSRFTESQIVAILKEGEAGVTRKQRWGFWKCHDRLRAQGYSRNHKRTWRVYCQLRLNLPRRTKRRLPKRERQPLVVEPRVSAIWALDFMRDTLYSGKVFRTLNVIDEASRGALGIDQHGRPRAIRCDNGSELASQAFTEWCGAYHGGNGGPIRSNPLGDTFNQTVTRGTSRVLLCVFADAVGRSGDRLA